MSKHNSIDEQTEQAIREIVRDEQNQQVQEATEGYSRREIIEGVAVLGTGAAVGGLSTYGAIGRASAQTGGNGTIGTSDNPLDAIYVDQLFQNTDNLSVGELEVNTRQLYLQPTEPSNPSQGDVWIDTSEVE